MRYGSRPSTLWLVGKGKRRRGGGLAATSALPTQAVNTGVLAREFFGERIPKSENYRRYLGKNLDLQQIEYSIKQATFGFMRPITDLSRETLNFDGHLASLLQKRLNRLAALSWDLTPAASDEITEINQDRAEYYAAFVRSQLKQIPSFRDAIVDLAWGTWDARAASELDWAWFRKAWNVVGINWIHPRRLSFGPFRDLRVVDAERDMGSFRDDGFALEQVPYKFIHYRPRLFCDYPEREGLSPRAMYWSWFQRFGTREQAKLVELCNGPWRVLRQIPGVNAPVNTDAAESAFEKVKQLGVYAAARMPPGWQLDIVQPGQGAGAASTELVDHASKVLSKLILGNTGTTDAVSTGLGSSIGDAHLSEEDLIIASDALRLQEVIEDQLTDAIIAVNFGPGALDHAPRFQFRTEPPVSREQEITRIKGAIEVGLRVSEEEAREKLGVQEIREGQPYLQRVQRPVELGQVPQAPAPELVYPIGEAPKPGELSAAPFVSDSLGGDGGDPPPAPPGGLPPAGAPPALPPGAPATPPGAAPAAGFTASDEDEPDAVQRLADRMTELGITQCEHGRQNRCLWCGVERERDVELVDGQAVWIKKWRPIKRESAATVIAPQLRASGGVTNVDPFFTELEAESQESPELVVLARHIQLRKRRGLFGEHICAAKAPSTVFGSPDTMVERGIEETTLITGQLAEQLASAVRGLDSSRAIRDALNRAGEAFGVERLARPIERELLHGCMLGALDSWFEMEEGVQIEVESFEALHAQICLRRPSIVAAERDRRFAAKPMEEAIRSFMEKQVVTRDEFDSMKAAAQKKAFTVAKLANEEMVRTVKRELVRQIALGADLNDFGRHAAERFEQAGWTELNPSHVDNIFRTNMAGAYNGGRERQMTQPEVLALRPFHQIMTPNDGPPRQRHTHQMSHGITLAADDPVWADASPPFGYRCRCRKRSLSIKQGASQVQEGRKARGRDGSVVFDHLPDPGFTSGTTTLL